MATGNPVLINDLSLFRPRAGVAGYVAQLLEHMPREQSEFRLVRLSQTRIAAPVRAVYGMYSAKQTAAAPEAEGSWLGPARRAAQTSVRLAKQLASSMIDRYLAWSGRVGGAWPLYHEPDGLPLDLGVPTVTTIHDLSVLLFPRWHPRERVRKYKWRFRAGLLRTDLFLTDAEFTRNEMVRHLGIPARCIRVIPLAPRPVFRRLEPSEVEAVRRRLRLPEKYLLFVGTIEPRKNVAGLLRSYAMLPDRLRREYPLLLAGGWGWKSAEVRRMLQQRPWRDSVRWLGYLGDEQLVGVVNASKAVLYPSFYEGFGLPTLEAMACDRPVVSTHCGSLAEVVADAALVVDPHDESNLAAGIRRLLENPSLETELRQRGRERLRAFDWSTTVRQTASVYAEACRFERGRRSVLLDDELEDETGLVRADDNHVAVA